MDLMNNLFNYYVISSILGLIITYLLYRLSIKNHNYWKERNIPFVKPYPLIGSILEEMRKKMEDLDLARRKSLGNIYGYYEGNKPAIFIGEPKLLRDILVKDFQYFSSRRVMDMGDPVLNKFLSTMVGEDWKRVRSVVSPTFSTGKIKRVLGIFQECCCTLVKSFNTASQKKEPLDVLKTYGAVTMDIIASSAFSTKINSHDDPDNIFVRKAKKIFNQEIGFKFLIFLIAPFFMRKLNISPFSKETLEFFKKIPLEMISERRRTVQKRNDFLQLLIESADEIVEDQKMEEDSEDIAQNYGDDYSNHSVFKNISTKSISKDELVAQCVLFFVAGYHTTAVTLSIVTYLLAVNQNVQDTLFNEIKETLDETNGDLTYESIQKMKYLDNIISESLRMYPPASRLERMAHADYKLGDTGIVLPKGTIVAVPVFAMHMDAKLFPEPEVFNPDRFSPEERDNFVPYSYMPFGMGPRNCVAMRFALMEVKVCLIHVFSTFLVKIGPETKVPIEFERGMGVLRPKAVNLYFEKRHNSSLKVSC